MPLQMFVLFIVLCLIYIIVRITTNTNQTSGPIYNYTNGSYSYLRKINDSYQLFVSMYTEVSSENTIPGKWVLSANDGTNDLEIIEVGSKVKRNLVEEVFIVSLSRGYLVQRLESGIEIKILCTGKGIITLPPEYVKDFLKMVNIY